MSNGPVVILGAGPAGLAAAHELTRQGVRPIIFEKSDSIGGISRTEIYKGYHFDIGGHRFFTKIKTIEALWQEMLGQDFIKVSRLSRIYYQNRFFDYPLRLSNALRNLGLFKSVLITLSYFQALMRPHGDERTFEQWVSNRFGRRLYKLFFKTYTEKVWGLPCHEIRADWASQRIKGLSLITAVTNALLKNQKVKSLIEEFDYPVLGSGMMWDRFREKIETGGGRFHLNSEVVGLRHENGRISGIVFNNGEELTEMAVGIVISSIPITKLVMQLMPQAPEGVLDAAGRLSYRSFIIVTLILDRSHLFPDQWIYVHSPKVRVGRIQNFKNWSSAMVPDPGKSSIGMEYFCDQGDELWRMKDEKLSALAAKELHALGLAETGDVIDSHVIRQPKAYPVYDRDYRRHLSVVRDYIGTVRDLQTSGRNGMHRYNNMDHTMVTGILAARNVLGESHNLWEVKEDQEYLEEEKIAKDPLHDPETILMGAFARMDKLAFAFAVGSVFGVLVFAATIWLVIKGGESVGFNLQMLSQYFMGYTVTVRGAFIAFGYSFVWGFLFGWLFAYLRNFLLASYIFWFRKKTELLSIKNFFDHL